MSHLSYEGQSEVDYCIECAVKHGQTAKVLMRESLQRAESEKNPASEGVKEKIRGIVEELTGMEDDTDTTLENENITKLNTHARDLRKHIYSVKAAIGGADIDTLRDIKARVDQLVAETYLVREKEEICVPCVSWICYGNQDCIEFLEEAAKTGDKERFQQAVEEAKTRFAQTESIQETEQKEPLPDYGADIAKERQRFLEQIRAEIGK